MPHLTRLILAVFLVLPAWASANARVFHVDPAGDDAHDGRHPARPWRTLARAAAEPLHPGDQILLRRGSVWREAFILNHGGAPFRPITLSTYGDPNDPAPEIAAADTPGAPARKFCIEANQSHIRIDGLRLTGAAGDGMAAVVVYAYRDLTDVRITRCEIAGNASRGIFVGGSPGAQLRGLVIAGNLIRDNDGSGILVTHAHAAIIADNQLLRNCRVAAEPWQAAVRLWSERVADARVERNVIADQQWGHANASAVGIHVDETGSGVSVSLNRIDRVDHAAIEVENARGVLIADNTAHSAEVGLFVYRAGHDHRVLRNWFVDCRSQGIALQGHRAGGVDAGPELEVSGRLFSGNLLMGNVARGSRWGSLKCVGGAERGVRVTQNDFGPPRSGLIEWGEAVYNDYAAWEAAAGAAVADRNAPHADRR